MVQKVTCCLQVTNTNGYKRLYPIGLAIRKHDLEVKVIYMKRSSLKV